MFIYFKATVQMLFYGFALLSIWFYIYLYFLLNNNFIVVTLRLYSRCLFFFSFNGGLKTPYVQICVISWKSHIKKSLWETSPQVAVAPSCFPSPFTSHSLGASLEIGIIWVTAVVWSVLSHPRWMCAQTPGCGRNVVRCSHGSHR